MPEPRQTGRERDGVDGLSPRGLLRWPLGRRRIALLAVVLSAVVVGGLFALAMPPRGIQAPLGFEPTGTPTLSPTPAPPIPSTTPPATLSPTPIPTPAATPTPPTPAPAPEADPEVGHLVFSISYGNVGGVFTSSLVEDGRLTSVDGASYMQRRLTPSGVELVRSEILATGLFGASASYPLVQLPGVEPPGMGLAGYHVNFAKGSELIEVSWPTGFDDGTWFVISPERQALDRLAERLNTLWEWLPESAWIDATPRVYRAHRFRLFTDVTAWGGPLADLPPEATNVRWPLAESLLTFGEARSAEFPALRCAVISADDAKLVATALDDAGAPFEGPFPPDFGTRTALGMREAPATVQLIIEALRPEETECTPTPSTGW